MAWKEVEDGLLISPSDPCRWREKLWTRNDKVFRIVVNCLGVVYFVMLFVILSYQDDVVYIGEIENASPLLFCMGLLPPFIYFYRRFNRDRLTQGFLDGYVEGYCDAFDEYKQKHNIVTDKLVAKIDERNEY